MRRFIIPILCMFLCSCMSAPSAYREKRIDRIEVTRKDNINISEQFYYYNDKIKCVSVRCNNKSYKENGSKYITYNDNQVKNICFSTKNYYTVLYDVKSENDQILYKESTIRDDGSYIINNYSYANGSNNPIITENTRFSKNYEDYSITTNLDTKKWEINEHLQIFPNCIRVKQLYNKGITNEYYLNGELFGMSIVYNMTDSNYCSVYIKNGKDYELLYNIKLVWENGKGNYTFRIEE
jgi:hypothetical protein